MLILRFPIDLDLLNELRYVLRDLVWGCFFSSPRVRVLSEPFHLLPVVASLAESKLLKLEVVGCRPTDYLGSYSRYPAGQASLGKHALTTLTEIHGRQF